MRRVVIYLAQIHADRPNIYKKIKYELEYPFSYGFTQSGLTLNINQNLSLSSTKTNLKNSSHEGTHLNNILKTIIIIHRHCSKKIAFMPHEEVPICRHLKEL